MPTTIPYDPSLVLGNILDPERVDNLKRIAEEQKRIDAGQDKLNALLLYKSSLEMTMQEMISMEIHNQENDGATGNGASGNGSGGNVNPEKDLLGPLKTGIDKLKTDIVEAAVQYGNTVIEVQKAIADLKSGTPQTQIGEEIESPIDYNKSALKKMPLSSDSLKMDAQYFRFEKNAQSADNHANSVASYVSYSTRSILGPKAAAQISGSVKSVVAHQADTHNLQGTLIITANCTHKQADVFAPFVLDVDKAIACWNAAFKDDPIDVDDENKFNEIIKPSNDPTKANLMNILSGATYGSSFVGMVHILQEEDTTSSQSATALATSLRAEMRIGSWLAQQEGKFGVDSSFANSVKSILSTSTLQSHCSVITMGLIPSLKSNSIKTMVKQLTGSPKEHMEELAAIQGATNTDLTTVATSASTARDGKSVSTLSTDKMAAAISAISQIDTENNKVLDTNSLMTAFEDFIQKAIAGESGVPINFFIKPITKKQLAKAWVNKYHPEFGDVVVVKEQKEQTE